MLLDVFIGSSQIVVPRVYTLPLTMLREFQSPASLPALGVLSLSIVSHFDWCIVVLLWFELRLSSVLQYLARAF